MPLHFTAFHPDCKPLGRPPTPARARRQAMAHGPRYVYTGNVHDEGGGSTYCLGCGEFVIGRDCCEPTARRLDARGHCTSCGTAIAGRFEALPGSWGARRRPVRLRAS